jgi:hypothetical protein
LQVKSDDRAVKSRVSALFAFEAAAPMQHHENFTRFCSLFFDIGAFGRQLDKIREQ